MREIAGLRDLSAGWRPWGLQATCGGKRGSVGRQTSRLRWLLGTYSAVIESASSRDTDAEPPTFTRRLRREAERRGFPDAPRPVVLGDGAKRS
jgi:hypothetical protein